MMATRDGSLLKKKIEEWEKKKRESSEWFPFGENQTPGGGSPNRKFEAKSPLSTNREDVAQEQMDRPKSQAAAVQDRATTPLQAIPPGAIPLAAYNQLQQQQQGQQPNNGQYFQMPYYYPYQYPGGNGTEQHQMPWYYPPQYSFIPPGAIPITTHNPDGSPLCPLNVAEQLAAANATIRMGIPIPPPIPIPASMAASYNSEYRRPQSARSLDAEQCGSEMTSSQSSAAMSNSSGKENSRKLVYNDGYEDRLRHEQDEIERLRRENERVRREAEELEQRRAEEEEKQRRRELQRLQEDERKEKLFKENMEKASQEAAQLRKVRICKHVLVDNPDLGEKIGVPAEQGEALLKEVMYIESQKKANLQSRAIGKVSLDRSTAEQNVSMDARPIRPAQQNAPMTRASPGRRSLRVTNKEIAERVMREDWSPPRTTRQSMVNSTMDRNDDTSNALFTRIPTRRSRMRPLVTSPVQQQHQEQDGQRSSGSQSPDQNHNTSKNSPYEKATVQEKEFKTPVRPALRSPTYLNSLPSTPRSGYLGRRLEEKGYKPQENTLTMEAIENAEEERMKKHGSMSSLRASMVDLRRGSNMSLAEREQSPKLNRFASVTRASYESLRLKKNNEKNRATLDRLAHLRERLQSSETSTAPSTSSPLRHGSFRSTLKFDGPSTAL